MESMFPSQENSGSMVLLTNKTTQMSNKLLTLASPKPRGKCVCQHVRVSKPPIGTVWYIPVGWLCHMYLEYSCIREMNSKTDGSFVPAIWVLLALSLASMFLFTATMFLKIEQSTEDNSSGCKVQKKSALNHLLPALSCQKYPIQALSALLLIHSYLLLQISTSAPDLVDREPVNGTEHINRSVGANNSEVGQWAVLPLANRFTCLLFCGNLVLPLIFHSMKESDPVWQKEKLWGFLYSVTLLLATIKYLSSSFTFLAVRFEASQYKHSFLFHISTVWLPALHVISILSVFLFSLFLKIYVEFSCRVSVSGPSATNLTLRRMIKLCPSPIGVILSATLIVACEIPFMMKLCFLYTKGAETLILCLFAINLGFCIFCVSTSVIVGFRKTCVTNKIKPKQRQADSGVSLANSFVYQSNPNTNKPKCLLERI